MSDDVDPTPAIGELQRIAALLHDLNESEQMVGEALDHWPVSDRHQAARAIANITNEVANLLFQLAGYIQ